MSSKYPHIDRNGREVKVGDRVRFSDTYGYRNQSRLRADGVIKSIHSGDLLIDIAPSSYTYYGRDGDRHDSSVYQFHSEFEFNPSRYETSRDKGRDEVLNVWLEVL